MSAIAGLAERLHAAGVREAFGITGSGPTLSLVTEMEDRGIRYLPVAHEAAGALMAGGAARLTGRLGVSLSIKGPGLANAFPGIVANHYENASALSIAEAFGDDAPAWRKHKRLDQGAVLSSVVKAQGTMAQVDGGWDALVSAARAEAPGPVHLDLGGRASPSPATPGAGPEAGGDRAAVLDRVAAARRPVVIAGSLALRRPWAEALRALRVPVFTTCAAKGAVDESAPHAAGVYTGDGKELSPEASLFRDADLVVGLGLRNTEILTARAFPCPYVSVDEVGGDLAEGLSPALRVADADAAFVGDVLAAVSAEWGADEVAAALGRMRAALEAGRWLPAACFAALNAVPFAHAAVMDTGSFCTVGEHLWRASPSRPYLGSSNGRFMGTGLPTAIGAAASTPDLPVVCATGDGGLRMYVPEIKLAVAERLPVCVVLMSDGRYGSIACAPQPRAMSTRAVAIDGPSWWRTIEAMGCAASPVDSADALSAALAGWDRRGPLFLEAAFAPEPYAAMTNGLR